VEAIVDRRFTDLAVGCHTGFGAHIYVRLPDKVMMEAIAGCQALRRHFSRFGASISRIGVEIGRDGRNSVWALPKIGSTE
jgi:hypothetical protein